MTVQKLRPRCELSTPTPKATAAYRAIQNPYPPRCFLPSSNLGVIHGRTGRAGAGVLFSQSGIGARGYFSLLPFTSYESYLLPPLISAARAPPAWHDRAEQWCRAWFLLSVSSCPGERILLYSYGCVLHPRAARIVPAMWLSHALRSVAKRSSDISVALSGNDLPLRTY
ncbi:hypothetical protein DFH08DRAFT_384818 [Mycena albidolilacea]|uniref:Uncharacterized protein n=1 Tax=Mycena albidolilacea TaxID=1033008 RepID=A0AAD6ZFH0_9AGAR|nr:hypothetical protein DFH08DRAFT_384818 [Mycena albidolilacea]